MLVTEVEKMIMIGKRVRKSTLLHYKNAFESVGRFQDHWFENAVEVNGWVASMPESYSDETVIGYYNCMMAAGNFLQKSMGRNKDGSFKFFNVMVDAERPKAKKKSRRIFEKEQLVDILKACRSEQEIALISTLIDSTCRVGELVGLRLVDIGQGYFICRQGEGIKTGQRRYSLDVRICEQLAGLVKDKEEVIFKNKEGNPAKVYNLEYYVRAIVKRAGLTGKKLGAHTLRHSGATLIAKVTGSALAVKAALQHDKIETSMKYIHGAEELMQSENSPMAMVNMVPQVSLKLTEKDGDVVDGVVENIDLVDDMFDRIPDNIFVRPRLGTKDLLMLREVMVEYTRGHRGDKLVYECQGLLKRVLRKAR